MKGPSPSERSTILPAWLLRQGVPAPRATDLFGRAGQPWLATLTLPGYAGQGLAGHRHWLAALTHDVEAVTAEVERVATIDPIVRRPDDPAGLAVAAVGAGRGGDSSPAPTR